MIGMVISATDEGCADGATRANDGRYAAVCAAPVGNLIPVGLQVMLAGSVPECTSQLLLEVVLAAPEGHHLRR